MDGVASGQGVPCVVLPASVDLTAAADLKSQLEHAFAEGMGLQVDAGAVQRITSPCLQVLAAAAKSFAEAGGAEMRIAPASTAFRETVCTLGLQEILGTEGLQS